MQMCTKFFSGFNLLCFVLFIVVIFYFAEFFIHLHIQLTVLKTIQSNYQRITGLGSQNCALLISTYQLKKDAGITFQNLRDYTLFATRILAKNSMFFFFSFFFFFGEKWVVYSIFAINVLKRLSMLIKIYLLCYDRFITFRSPFVSVFTCSSVFIIAHFCVVFFM